MEKRAGMSGLLHRHLVSKEPLQLIMPSVMPEHVTVQVLEEVEESPGFWKLSTKLESSGGNQVIIAIMYVYEEDIRAALATMETEPTVLQ